MSNMTNGEKALLQAVHECQEAMSMTLLELEL